MKLNKKLMLNAITVIMAVIVIIAAAYIVVHHMGLVDGYDFGVGAYYYVDIPDFSEVLPNDAYQTNVPVWVHVALFIAWGWLMWRLWLWIDMKSRK
ncbi:MAG: hypothetical protein IJN02_11955 [Bacteroidales bacterium]|nr:hypothetical protein [Bacteroidales bacterium]MBQ6689930.1 hypothetical protein [Bacteroidales bacterium]